jgi:hypothetical protein
VNPGACKASFPLFDLASIADNPIAQFSTTVCIWSIFLKFRVLNLDVNRWFGWIAFGFFSRRKCFFLSL